VSLPERKQAAKYLLNNFSVSTRFVCKLLKLNRNTLNYKSKVDRSVLIKQVCELSNRYPRWGYRKITDYLRIRGVKVCKETVRSIRKQSGLQVKRKQRKRRLLRAKPTLHQAEYINHVWSWDFMFDTTFNGRKLKVLNIIDEHSKELLVSYVARTITAKDVYKILQKLFVERGYPKHIRSDNGSEFVAKFIQDKLSQAKVNVIYIQPGSPWQNPYIESFNSIMRDNLLNRYLFFTPKEAQVIINNFKTEYNTERPHGSLGGITPHMFVEQCLERKLCA